MGYPTKVQLIERTKGANQWYVNFPTVLARSLDFEKGEVVEWSLQDRETLILKRRGQKVTTTRRQRRTATGATPAHERGE